MLSENRSKVSIRTELFND